jgi:WD40 repeat protein
VSASWDGTVRLWDTREGCCLAVAHLLGVSKVLASADGQCLFAGTTRGEVLVLDLVGIAPLSAVSLA